MARYSLESLDDFVPDVIAFAGDWHMNGPYAAKAIEYARERGANVVVHLGDFGYTFERRYMLLVAAALRWAGIPLLFVDGNHEDFDQLHRYPVNTHGLRSLGYQGIWHLPRGTRWQWGDTRFLALGGAHSVDRQAREEGVSWWPQERITPFQATIVVNRGPADVLIAHDCPSGVPIPGLDTTGRQFPLAEITRSDQHRALLRTVVDAVRPRAIWHGHYHQRCSARTVEPWGEMLIEGLDRDGSALAANVQTVQLTDLPQLTKGVVGDD